MSAAVNSSAAVSFGSPQDVEVLVDGAWVPGAMLGWRHDDSGGCEAWVRLRAEVPGVVEGAGTWVELAAVRLPERHLTLAPAAGVAPDADAAPATAAMPAVVTVAASRAGRPSRSRRHGADGTAEQPAVRAAVAGRHRAPAAAGAGRHRAVTMEMPAVVVGSAAEHGPGEAAAGVVDATVVAPAVTAPVRAEEPDLLTRPIRLGDLVAHPRGGRPAVPTA